MILVEFNRVTKRFHATVAVKDISFTITPGSVYGILGPNGAGKTTVLRILVDIIHPDEGEVSLFGSKMNAKTKDRIGYLPEERGLYSKMKVFDILVFLMRLKGVGLSAARHSANVWLERCGLLDSKEIRVEQLSKGMAQKVQFVASVAHNPDLVVLDEPFAGLDPINTQLIKDIILELRERGKTIVLATHLLEEAERLSDEVILVNKGTVALEGHIREIKASYGQSKVVIGFDGKEEFVKDTKLVRRAEVYGHYLELYLQQEVDPQDLLKLALTQGRVDKFELVEPSLRDIFVQTMEGRSA